MKTTGTDCIVVGGGLLGMLSASRLARAGLTVRLVERGLLCREASWAGGGILSPLVPWESPDAVTELVAWSQARYPQLAAELLDDTGIDVEWTRSGMLQAGVSLDATTRDWACRHRVRVEPLDSTALRAADSALAADIGQALLLPEVAQVRNPRLGRALRVSLEHLGVIVQEHCPVISLRISRGTVQGVATAHGPLDAPDVVVAGGAWSPGLVAAAGMDLPVTPVRGQMIQFQAEPGLLRHIVLRDGCYLIPRRDGLVLAGSTLERVGYDNTTTAGARRQLQERAVAIVPELASCRVVRHWSGLRPASPEGVPFIGPCPEIRGLYLNTGHFRNGVVMAPASAQLLLDSMTGQASLADFGPYRPPRAIIPADAT